MDHTPDPNIYAATHTARDWGRIAFHLRNQGRALDAAQVSTLAALGAPQTPLAGYFAGDDLGATIRSFVALARIKTHTPPMQPPGPFSPDATPILSSHSPTIEILAPAAADTGAEIADEADEWLRALQRNRP